MSDSESIQLALTAVAACALAIQTIFMIVAGVIALKMIRKVREEMEQYRSSLMPVIVKTRELVENLGPKIEEAAGEISTMTKSLRAQTAEFQSAAEDIIGRTRRQASRVDGMLTTVFDRVERAGTFMSDAVARPMRQVSGLIASVRAAVETLRDPEAAHRAPHASQAVPRRYPDGEHSGPHPAGATTPYQP